MRFSRASLLTVAILGSQISACTVGPDYLRPEAPVATEFKELNGWKTAEPQDHVMSSDWWTAFNDPMLNQLQQQVTANQSLIQAEAQYRQAQYLVQSSQSSLLPLATLNGSFNNFKSAKGTSQVIPGVRTLFGNTVAMAWEPDLWGSVRRQIEANTDNAQASAALLHGLRLSTQASLAQAYFQLRALDAERKLFDETVDAYQQTLKITQNRYAVGVVAKTDVVQAETQLQSVKAQALNLGIQRATFEHAIAVLIGKAPSELAITSTEFNNQTPVIPVNLPSELLERRPDIAAAERQVAAANAQIGVAKAAYYPRLNLAMTNGYQSSDVASLFSTLSRYWALGPAAAALSIFDGGVKNAQYKQAIASFDASVAAYRQTVLTGFQEVEDNLAALRILEQERTVQAQAVTAADKALELITNQYKAGTVSYLNVMTAQASALSNHQTAVQLQQQQLNTSVALIKALGGGWQAQQLPTEEQADGERKWTDYLILPLTD